MTVFVDVQYTQEYIDLELPILDYAKPNDVGIDLFAVEDKELHRHTPKRVRTGIKVAVPEKHGMFIFPKSGVSLEGIRMANGVGVVDPSYRGEVQAPLIYDGVFGSKNIYAGQAIVQFIILPCPTVICRGVEELSETERGENGFGSTRK